MRFSRIILENWRNFGHVDVALQNRAFLVGPNASGKSNFLDVFRFLRDLVIPGGGFEQAVNSRGGFIHLLNMRSWLSRGIGEPFPDMAVQVEIQPGQERDSHWSYRLSFNLDAQGNPILTSEQVWQNDVLVLKRPNTQDANDPKQLRQTYLEQSASNFSFRPVAEFFETIGYFHFIPQFIRNPELIKGRENDPYGSDLVEQIARLNPENQRDRLKRIVQALSVVVPPLTDLKLEEDKRGIPHLKGTYRHGDILGVRDNLEMELSDGTLRLIGLLWALLDTQGPLLFEEPELSLHPAVVRHIPLMMWRVQSQQDNRQIVLSTHSSELLRDEGIAADEVLLFQPVELGTSVQAGNDIEEVRRLMESGLAAAEVAMSYTQPRDAILLALWGD